MPVTSHVTVKTLSDNEANEHPTDISMTRVDDNTVRIMLENPDLPDRIIEIEDKLLLTTVRIVAED